MKQRSLFDVVSPIMTGPSGSHTAGTVRSGMYWGNPCNNSNRAFLETSLGVLVTTKSGKLINKELQNKNR